MNAWVAYVNSEHWFQFSDYFQPVLCDFPIACVTYVFRYFANIKRGCNVNVETLSDLVFNWSLNVSYQTSNNLHSVSQNLVHNQHKYNQQNWV